MLVWGIILFGFPHSLMLDALLLIVAGYKRHVKGWKQKSIKCYWIKKQMETSPTRPSICTCTNNWAFYYN